MEFTIKEALPFGLTGISGMIQTYIDSVMLSLIQGNEVVGWYNAAYRLILVFLFIPTVVNMAVFPVMSRFFLSSRDSLELIYEKYFKYMILLGVPLGFGTTILADKIILLIFGEGYSQSIIALQILIWTIVLTFAGAAFVQLLQSVNKQLLITKISGICVVFNIVLNLILIPKFSYIGASISTLITELVLVGGIFIVSYRIGYKIHFNKIKEIILKVIFASVIMSIFIWYLKNLNLFILAGLGILVYLTILYLIKGIDEEDMDIFKQIVGK